MTNVKCVRDGREYTIDIVGHSGYKPGMDIVCSASSVLGYTLINALSDLDTERSHVNTYEDGELHICIVPTLQTAEAARIIINTIMLGYVLLADQYPDNVSVEW